SQQKGRTASDCMTVPQSQAVFAQLALQQEPIHRHHLDFLLKLDGLLLRQPFACTSCVSGTSRMIQQPFFCRQVCFCTNLLFVPQQKNWSRSQTTSRYPRIPQPQSC